jgi:hypothetical protein
VSHRTGLDDMEEGKFLTHLDSNSDPSVVQPDCAIPAPRAWERREMNTGTRKWKDNIEMDLKVILWQHRPRKDFSGRSARMFTQKLTFKPFEIFLLFAL